MKLGGTKKPTPGDGSQPVATGQPTPANKASGNQHPAEPKTKNKKLRQVAISLLLLAAAAGVIIAYNNQQDKPSKESSQPIYNTAKMTEHTVLGSAPGRAMAFKKPAELGIVGGEDKPTVKGFIRLAKSPNDPNAYINTARILATTKDFSSPDSPNEAYLSEVARTFSQDPASASYQNDMANLKKFVDDAFVEPTITVTVGKAALFTNANIKTNAWQIEIITKDSSGLTPEHNGKLIWVAGKKSNYKFFVSAVASDWKSNSNVWQKVLDSIEIDQ